MEGNTLPTEILNELRGTGVITATEVVYKEGDLFIAKDVVTNAKRIIEYRGSIHESQSGKRLLKG